MALSGLTLTYSLVHIQVQPFLLALLLLTQTGASPSSYSSSSSEDYYTHDAATANAGDYIFDHQVHGDMPYPASDYGSDWTKLSGRMQAPQCVPIPSNLTLCQDLGYHRMRLPNHLEHETLKEVVQQAASWVPLERIKCHPDTKIFLCSLFSPICLENARRIFPCRSLCLAVKDNCEHRMKVHGFDWPEMLNCDQFPEDNDMCIGVVHKVEPPSGPKKCSACDHPMTHEAIIDHYCRADVAVRARLKEFKQRDGHKELVLGRKRRLLKFSPDMAVKDVRRLSPVIEHGEVCDCDSINQTHHRYLLMGNRVGGDLILTFGMPWNRKNKEMRKGVRAMRKGGLCQGGIFQEISSTNGMESAKTSNNKKDRKKRRNRKGKGRGKGKKKNGKGKKRRRGGKKGGKRNRKGRKGKGKKNRGEKNANSTRRNKLTKSEKEDQALRNFEKVAK